ncbi:MAG: ADP-ribosylglycohydrolase family protein [Verrucomicrobiaceae bacterium]
MLGALIGDICGSTYEFRNIKDPGVYLMPAASEITDDSILCCATAEVILQNGDYAEAYWRFGNLYPNPMGGYGARFKEWLRMAGQRPYYSCGNGSAMRVVPVGWAFNSVELVLTEAEKTAAVSHNHPEGIKGAQATALAIFLARQNTPKEVIRAEISSRFSYDLNRTCDQIRFCYGFKETCQQTVPEAIIAFLESNTFEEALRLAISLGGDADTLACITGGIAEAWYGCLPQHLVAWALPKLPQHVFGIAQAFYEQFVSSSSPFSQTA